MRAAYALAPAILMVAAVGHADGRVTVVQPNRLPNDCVGFECDKGHSPDAPPWVDVGDVPVPAWAKSIAPNRQDAALYMVPGKLETRRGSTQLGARLPLFATKRASGCQGRWLEVGPLAWICSDVADYSGDPPASPSLGTNAWSLPGAPDGARPPRAATRPLPPLEPTSPADDGLPFRYFFAGRDGAYGYASLNQAGESAPDQELEKGFAIAATEEKKSNGETWVKTKKNRWFSTRELVPARPFLFHGERIEDGKLDVGWIVVEKANVFASEKSTAATATRVRFEKVKIAQEAGDRVRVSPDGQPEQWIKKKEVARARLAPPPDEVGGASTTERWIDVDLAEQTLVAYEGTRPIFATIVSTGKGPRGTDTATPPGTHRIWVKIFTTKMDNLEKDDVEHHYALEDVPWVQFFDKAIALHGAFWHRDFGHIHSHGCVNLAPLDARWLFAFTGPHLPQGWTAVYPTKLEPGTAVRVR